MKRAFVSVATLGLLLACGCSLTRLERSECTENLQCQQGLGAASLCEAGYCVASTETTCTTAFNCSSLGPHFRCDSGVCMPASDVLCSVDNDHCVDELGVGGFCSPSGFCVARSEPPERCKVQYPTDLLDNPTAYIDYEVLGAIVIGEETTRTARARAVELAVRVVNEANGLNGEVGLPGGVQVGLVACTSQQDDKLDALSSSQASLEMASYLVNEVGAKVIIGPQTSANTLSVFDAIEGRALLISPSATSVQLIEVDNPSPTQADPGLLWRTVVSDVEQAKRLVDIIGTACAYQKVGLVYKDDAYGNGLADLIEAALPEGMVVDGNVADGKVGFPYTTISEQKDAQNAMAAHPDRVDVAVFIDSLPESNLRFLSAMQGNSAWEDRPILLPDAGATSDAVRGIESSVFVTRIRGTRPNSTPGPLLEDFQDTFEAFFGGIDPVSTEAILNDNVAFVAQAYDAAWLALYGIAWARLQEVTVSPKTIARGIRKLTDENPLDPDNQPTVYNVGASDWDDALFDLAGRNPIDLEGASSHLDFDLSTEELRFSPSDEVIDIYQYEDDGEGGFNVVKHVGEPGTCPFD